MCGKCCTATYSSWNGAGNISTKSDSGFTQWPLWWLGNSLCQNAKTVAQSQNQYNGVLPFIYLPESWILRMILTPLESDSSIAKGEGWCISEYSDMYNSSVRHFVPFTVALVVVPGDACGSGVSQVLRGTTSQV